MSAERPYEAQPAPPDGGHLDPGSGRAIRALLRWLGCGSVAPLGAVRHLSLRALEGLALVGEDAVDREVLVVAALDGLAEDPGELIGLCTRAAAVVLIDLSGRFGVADMRALHGRARAAGLVVEYACVMRASSEAAPLREAPLLVVSDGLVNPAGPLLTTGPLDLGTDSSVDLAAEPARMPRVCVASYEVVGPTRTGGIGTANTSLALALARAGHAVTLLFTGEWSAGEAEAERWRTHYAARGVDFEVLGTDSWVGSVHPNVRRAYAFSAWLAGLDEPFDVVHFPESQGHGYFVALGRAQGLFPDTLCVAGVHSSTRWCEEANQELPRDLEALVDDHLERTSVAHADVVVSPSAYMLDYLQERGWALPDRRFVQPYVLPPTAAARPTVDGTPAEAVALREIVFFGRLELRKGLEVFCDALDRLAADDRGRDLRVTFLGRPEHIAGEPSVDYVARRSRRWPWPYEVVGVLDQHDALARVATGDCLLVMPSTVDNAPNTVSEALGLGIPFVCSRGGGTGELIDPCDLDRVTIPGVQPPRGLPPAPLGTPTSRMDAQALHLRIVAALDEPAPARFSVDHALNERVHVAWNAAAAAATGRCAAGPGATRPRLAIGMLGAPAPEAASAIVVQRGEIEEVIIVAARDDEPADGLTAVCAEHGWRLLDDDPSAAGRARNLIAGEWAGEALLMCGGGEVLRDGAVAMIRDRLAVSTADVLCWPAGVLHRTSPEAGPAATVRAPVVVPVGGPPLRGLHGLALGLGGYAITRGALALLGGYAPDGRSAETDADLINRAQLAGLTVEVVAEPLADLLTSYVPDGDEAVVAAGRAAPEWDRDQRRRLVAGFVAAPPGTLAELPGLYANAIADAVERQRSDAVVIAERGEYITYLEHEHQRLSARIHEHESHRSPSALGGRIARRLARAVRGRPRRGGSAD